MTAIVVSETSSREEIAAAIKALKAKHDRMPMRWEAKRQDVMDEIFELIDQWHEVEA